MICTVNSEEFQSFESILAVLNYLSLAASTTGKLVLTMALAYFSYNKQTNNQKQNIAFLFGFVFTYTHLIFDI